MKIQEMIEQRKNLWEKAKNFITEKEDENGVLSDEDYETYLKMEKDIENLSRDIKLKERAKRIDEKLNQRTSEPLSQDPLNDIKDDKEIPLRARAEYKEAMLKALRSNFRNISNVLEEGTDESGGYLVPEEYDRRLIDGLEEENIVRKLATKITTSGLHKINIAATKPAALWVEEGGTLTFGDATFDQIALDAHKLHVAIKVTEELLYDSAFNIEGYIIDEFTKAISNSEEEAFLNGDGNGKPIGIFNKTKGGDISITSKSANISTDELIDLIYSLKRPYRKKAAFILNDNSLSHIRKLKDSNGVYLWQPAITQGEPDRLLGYPVHTSAFVSEIKKDNLPIAFGDFSYYNIGDRGTRSFQELKELFAGNGMIGFLAKERVDGRLVLPEAVKILKVGGTAS